MGAETFLGRLLTTAPRQSRCDRMFGCLTCDKLVPVEFVQFGGQSGDWGELACIPRTNQSEEQWYPHLKTFFALASWDRQAAFNSTKHIDCGKYAFRLSLCAQTSFSLS